MSIYLLIQEYLKVAVPEEPPTELNRTSELPSENSGGDVCPGASQFCINISASDDDKEEPASDDDKGI